MAREFCGEEQRSADIPIGRNAINVAESVTCPFPAPGDSLPASVGDGDGDGDGYKPRKHRRDNLFKLARIDV